jgi:hypothetical protein
MPLQNFFCIDMCFRFFYGSRSRLKFKFDLNSNLIAIYKKVWKIERVPYSLNPFQAQSASRPIPFFFFLHHAAHSTRPHSLAVGPLFSLCAQQPSASLGPAGPSPCLLPRHDAVEGKFPLHCVIHGVFPESQSKLSLNFY